MLVQYHCIRPCVALVGHSSGKPFVRKQHLLIAREFVHIPHIGFHGLHRDFCRRRSRDMAPVPAGYLISASEAAYFGNAIGKDLHAAMREIPPVVVGAVVDFRRPEVSAVSRYRYGPVVLPVGQRTVERIRVASRRRLLCREPGGKEFPAPFPFRFEPEIRFRKVPVYVRLSVRRPRICKTSVLVRDEGSFPIRMPSGHCEGE